MLRRTLATESLFGDPAVSEGRSRLPEVLKPG
jgi:hypothetical protein